MHAVELLHVAVAAQLAEPVLGIAERAGDPAQRHLSVPPALDVARVVRDRAVQVLDRVGRAQRAVQRAGDAQALDGQCFLQSLAQARGGAGMLGLQRGRQALQLLLGQLGAATVPGVAQRAPDAGVQFLGQVLDDVAPFVLLAALDECVDAEALDDGPAQRLAAVDHPQPGTVGIEPALDQIAQQRAHHARALGGALAQPQNVLVALASMPKATRMMRSRKWMPSIITTGRSSFSSGRDSHCANCSSLKATKRREVALLDAERLLRRRQFLQRAGVAAHGHARGNGGHRRGVQRVGAGGPGEAGQLHLARIDARAPAAV